MNPSVPGLFLPGVIQRTNYAITPDWFACVRQMKKPVSIWIGIFRTLMVIVGVVLGVAMVALVFFYVWINFY